LGDVVFLVADTFRHFLRVLLRWEIILNQIVEIGLLSQFFVVINGADSPAPFQPPRLFQFHKIEWARPFCAFLSGRDPPRVRTGLDRVNGDGSRLRSHVAEIGTMKKK